MDASEIEKLTVPKLKEELKKRGKALTGLKAELKARLVEALGEEVGAVAWLTCQRSCTRECLPPQYDLGENSRSPIGRALIDVRASSRGSEICNNVVKQ